MSTSPEEQKDLDKLKLDIALEKTSTWEYCKHLLRLDETSLAQAGHRNGVAQAIHDTMKKSIERVEKLGKAHVKKWPDEGIGRRR